MLFQKVGENYQLQTNKDKAESKFCWDMGDLNY